MKIHLLAVAALGFASAVNAAASNNASPVGLVNSALSAGLFPQIPGVKIQGSKITINGQTFNLNNLGDEYEALNSSISFLKWLLQWIDRKLHPATTTSTTRVSSATTTTATTTGTTPTPATVWYEAEDALLTGVNIANGTAGFHGSGYVEGFDDGGDQITWTVESATRGLYNLKIRYNAPFGDKKTTFALNGVGTEIGFPSTTGWTEVDAGLILLEAGANTLEIKSNWGWYLVDALAITPATPRGPHRVTPNLVNSNASDQAKDLYSLLKSTYGSHIISGQQDTASLKWVEDYVGRTPALQGLDLIDLSPSRVEHGTTSSVIEDAQAWDARGGIVALTWHWNAPVGLLDKPGQEWWRGFYTDSVDFDLSTAIVPGNSNYTLLVRDIDVIAGHLKVLRDHEVPVLWRPLHEADGGWFWWGAKGPEPCKKLYDLVYDRLANYHGLNNLIWVWNSASPEWYPGNSKVDIISIDYYGEAGDHGPLSAQYTGLLNLVNDTKIIALAENGNVPNTDLLQIYKADWSYFMTWNDNFIKDGKWNPLPYLRTLYNSDYVLTLDEIAGWKNGWVKPSSDPWVINPNPPTPTTGTPSVPTVAPTGTFTPIPQPTLVVYDTALLAGWENWSWGTELDWANIEVGGVTAVKATIAPWSSASFIYKNPSFGGYKNLHFQASGNGDIDLDIFVETAVGTPVAASAVKVSAICGGALISGQWSNCVLDLAPFGTTPWSRINFHSTNIGATVWLTNIYLEGQAEAATLPPTSDHTQSVYAGALADGWQNWSYGDSTTIDFESHDIITPSGVVNTLKASVDAWGALVLFVDPPVSGFKYLRFKVQGDGASFEYNLESYADGQITPNAGLTASCVGGSVVPGTWTECLIDLTKYGNYRWARFNFMNRSNNTPQTLYFSDVYFDGVY